MVGGKDDESGAEVDGEPLATEEQIHAARSAAKGLFFDIGAWMQRLDKSAPKPITQRDLRFFEDQVKAARLSLSVLQIRGPRLARMAFLSGLKTAADWKLADDIIGFTARRFLHIPLDARDMVLARNRRVDSALRPWSLLAAAGGLMTNDAQEFIHYEGVYSALVVRAVLARFDVSEPFAALSDDEILALVSDWDQRDEKGRPRRRWARIVAVFNRLQIHDGTEVKPRSLQNDWGRFDGQITPPAPDPVWGEWDRRPTTLEDAARVERERRASLEARRRDEAGRLEGTRLDEAQPTEEDD